MKPKILHLVGVVAVLGLPLVMFASPIDLVPPGLNPGDQYRIVFVTSTTTAATSSDFSYYDTFVNDAANAPGSLLQSLGATWQAIVSTDRISAADHIGDFSVPVFLVNGLEVATGSQQLWSGQILAPISLDEQGSAGAPVAWTGTGPDGSLDDPLGGSPASVGCTIVNTAQWIDFEPPNANTSVALPLYGISSILTVPEPGNVGMLVIGAVLLIAVRFILKAGAARAV